MAVERDVQVMSARIQSREKYSQLPRSTFYKGEAVGETMSSSPLIHLRRLYSSIEEEVSPFLFSRNTPPSRRCLPPKLSALSF